MNKCYQCGAEAIVTNVSGTYHYQECGLDDVYLVGIRQHTCTSCGEVYTELPRSKQLHRAIGEFLCQKKDILSGKEVTFLRKEMRKNGKEFSLMLSITAEHLSRIEHGQKALSGSLDTLIKALYTIYVCEGATVCKGALESFTGKKNVEVKHRRIELTPSDWLMNGGALCCTG